MISLGFVALLVVSLPVGIFLSQKLQDIRPRATISGQANFKLVSSNTTPKAGDEFSVNALVDITDPNVRVSGVDFRILYSKNLVESVPTIEAAAGDGKPFTDVILTQVDKPYDSQFNYLRVVLVSRSIAAALASGNNIQLATIKFKAKTDGDLVVKYPQESTDINKVALMQVVGINLGSPAPTNTTVSPTSTISPTVNPSGTVTPTITPEPTDTQ